MGKILQADDAQREAILGCAGHSCGGVGRRETQQLQAALALRALRHPRVHSAAAVVCRACIGTRLARS
jgi:hypothetical protein